MLIISPHLDDAVFSCGSLMARTPKAVTVITICAGIPDKTEPPSQFDQAAGFASGAIAMQHRREEDVEAASTIGYMPIHFDCLSDEYDRNNPQRAHAVTEATQRALDLAGANEVVVVPVGLRHPDHELVAAACRDFGPPHMWLYEEMPYSVLWPEYLDPALERFPARPVGALANTLQKQAAIKCFASQLIGMNVQALTEDEVYHRCQ